MKTTLKRSGIAAMALLFASELSASAQQGKNVSYWPLKKGSTWTLATTADERSTDQILTVTEVTSGKGYTTATLEYKANGLALQGEKYQTSAAGISRVASGPHATIPLSPPLPLIKYPLRAGDVWRWKGTFTQAGHVMSAIGDLSASGPETVKTPAGKFQAMKIRLFVTINMPQQKVAFPTDYWFAPNVGLIKQSANVNGVLIEGLLKSYNLK